MDIIIKVSQFLLSLSLLIVLHELGHYAAARIFKTRVEKFYLFFDAWGKKLFSFKKGDTEYGIGWLPLGGYVKISGMIDESMDKEQLKQPIQSYEFRAKPAWQRLIIMLGGVTVNFILGILIYIMIVNVWGEDYVKPENVKYGYTIPKTLEDLGFRDGDKILKVNGEVPADISTINKDLMFRTISNITVVHENGQEETIALPKNIGKMLFEEGNMFPFEVRIPAVIDSVIPKSPAAKSGIMKGDLIIGINNEKVAYANEVSSKIDSTQISLSLLRNQDTINVALVPAILNTKLGKHQIGINYNMKDAMQVDHRTYGFFESVSRGNAMAIDTFKDFINQFKYVFTKKGAGELGGFIAIGKIFPNTWDWQRFWAITAFLSIMLAIMNLLPIPALDGGHALFTVFEMLTGRKPSDKFLEYAQIVGFVLLMALVLYANGNDIYKLFK